MNRRNFLSLTGTFTSGALILPNFLHAFGTAQNLVLGDQCLVFIQLNGGNDGLNTYVPFEDELYYKFRPNIGLSKDELVGVHKGMAFHPSLKDFALMQQNGDLSVIQNVGYANPVRSHFRSQEIWQTAPTNQEYINQGWLGRYLDLQCNDHQPTAGINIDSIDNLALKGDQPNSITVRDPERFSTRKNSEEPEQLSGNPQLDFVRKIASSVLEGSEAIQAALQKAGTLQQSYPKSALSKNLQWIGRLIKGNLHSKVYYTSMGGFDTHDNQLIIHQNRLKELNDAVFSFYTDLKNNQLLSNVTIVIFSEFGRRVADNTRGTDHGTAAPMFIIGGNNMGKVIGSNPNLSDLDQGDLKYQIDFRSVYAALLEQKLDFKADNIGIKSSALTGLF